MGPPEDFNPYHHLPGLGDFIEKDFKTLGLSLIKIPLIKTDADSKRPFYKVKDCLILFHNLLSLSLPNPYLMEGSTWGIKRGCAPRLSDITLHTIGRPYALVYALLRIAIKIWLHLSLQYEILNMKFRIHLL